ncbi:MAG: GspH/FimT family pseudopilin [Longimicrobiales bacterium]|nr:GspH/FimT family pseudopilin [Longimicrobiales bacterium]
MISHGPPSARDGFSLVELTVVLLIAAVLTAISVIAVSSVQTRAAARSAAQHFSRDLAQARSWARRTNEAVTITFDERADSLVYTVVGAGGDTLSRRPFRNGGEIRLDSFDLLMAGDTLRFEADGIASLAGAQPPGPYGVARFVAGPVVYFVHFNATGGSVVEAG